MDCHNAVHGRSDTEAATDLPADDAGSDEQLRPTLEHTTLLRFPTTTGRGPTGNRADLPSSLGAVDAACTTTAAELPRDVPTVDGAIHSPTGGFPAGGPAIFERLHGPL
jgi:hypothetical protein